MSNKLIGWFIVMVLVLGIYGCTKKPTSSAPQPAPTKTAAEYKAEADKQITEQNASQELSKLEQELAADANQP